MTVFILVASLLPSSCLASDSLPEPNLVVGDDMIVSYDEVGPNHALHPSVAISPRGNQYEGTIHVVWDEYDDISGFREIHYSSSEDEGMTWTHDRDDFIVSNMQKSRANNGNAINPSIAVDPLGNVHVIWTEQIALDGTWEVFYSFSTNNGLTWSSSIADIRISQRVGSNNDAASISSPKLIIGTPLVPGKAFPVFHAVWSEQDRSGEQELIHYSRSINGGGSWSGLEADDILSEQGQFSRDPAIAYSGSDANFVHLSWTQVGPLGFDEIFYRMSDNYGNKGTWREIRPISCIRDDGMMTSDVTFAGGASNDVHAVWKQYPIGKAPQQNLFYSSSFDNGGHWNGVDADFPISSYDGFEPFEPCVSVGDRRVQVMWTEIDEKSPKLTMEIHTSWTDDPTNPTKWTGLEADIVLSNGDEWVGADARNASMQMGYMSSGYWKPVFVWDELNDNPSTKDRVDRSNEIHTEPLPEWILTVTVSGGGTVTKNPNQATYTDGTTVTLTANPDAGWHFDHWEGDLYSFSNPDSILMDDDKYVTAYFAQDQYTLTVNVYGSGSVTKSPNQATYTYGQGVTLTATPAFGWRFDHWSGAISGTTNPRSITMYSSYIVNAHFYQNIFYRNLTVGWNLVSLPYVQASTSITTVMSSISGSYDVVKYYNVQDSADPWKTYRIGGTANDLANADYTSALWVHATAPCMLTVYGDIPSSTAIPLYTGWNLVGYPSATSRLASATLPPVADIVGIWSATSPYVVDYTDKTLVTMTQGNGYWVHVTADTTWNINW